MGVWLIFVRVDKQESAYILLIDKHIIMLQPTTLAIAEASLLFYSHHYQHLKCKIKQNRTAIVLCSKLINNCIETVFNINRDLQDFCVELYQDAVLVGVFNFTYDDLDNAISEEGSQDRGRKRKRKFIKFKKENDCCSLYFTIEAKDVIMGQENWGNQEYVYEDYVRHIAGKLYKKLETNALRRIDKIEKLKLGDKRMSINVSGVETEKYGPSDKNEEKGKANQSVNSRIQKMENPKRMAQSWMFSGGKRLNSFSELGEKPYKQKKDDYKLKKMRQRALKMFYQDIKTEEKDLVIIPKVKMTRDKMGLMSEGIVFPCRVKSENASQMEIGVRKDAFLDTFHKFQPQSLKNSNISSQLFGADLSSKISRKTSNLVNSSIGLFSIREKRSQLKTRKNTTENETHKSAMKSSRPCILKKQPTQPIPTNFNQTFIIKCKAAIKFR